MEPFREDLIRHNSPFPVDIFISDNLKENISAKPHWHECYEILYVLDGAAEQQINNNFFNAQKYDLIILKEGDIHSTFCCRGENTKVLVIKFLPEILENSYGKIFELKYILSFLNYKSEHIHHMMDMSKNSIRIYTLMMGLYEEFTKKDIGYEIYIKGYFNRTFKRVKGYPPGDIKKSRTAKN